MAPLKVVTLWVGCEREERNLLCFAAHRLGPFVSDFCPFVEYLCDWKMSMEDLDGNWYRGGGDTQENCLLSCIGGIGIVFVHFGECSYRDLEVVETLCDPIV